MDDDRMKLKAGDILRARVAEDVERVRRFALLAERFALLAETGKGDTIGGAISRVLDALETAQAEIARLKECEAERWATDREGIQELLAEAREKDETIARLREALEEVTTEADNVAMTLEGEAPTIDTRPLARAVTRSRRALTEQGDDRG